MTFCVLAAGVLVWTSLASGGAHGAGGSMVMGGAGVDKNVTDFLEIEGHSGIGGIGTSRDSGLTLTRFGGGARLIPVNARFRPFLYGGFAHWHEVSFDNLKKRPYPALSSDPTAGVHHRTGLEAGAGISWKIPLPDTSAIPDHLFYEARVSTVWLPDTQGPNDYLMVESCLGYRF